MRMPEGVSYERLLPGREVIVCDNIMAVSQQPVDKSTSDKTGSAGDECSQVPPENGATR